jgi:uncharacterized protein YkwD
MSALLELRDMMLNVLQTAAKERNKRSKWVNNGKHLEPEWVIYERAQLFEAVNQERALRGLPSLTLDDIRRVEYTAEGHIDYASKFALYCAELVLSPRTK